MTKRKPLKQDDTVTVIAQLFNCTNSYVRQIMADTKHERYKGDKPMAIRQAYLKYKHGKQRIISQLQQLKQAA